MALDLDKRVWVLVERLYITVYGEEDFIEFLKQFDIDYPGIPYQEFNTTRGLYMFMSREDYTFSRFMNSVSKSKYLPILEEILFDPKIQDTQSNNWNYYGEYIRNWYPRLIRFVESAGFKVKNQEVQITYDYDVALSFAGEDRPYVEQVADILQQLNLRVFYDRYEEADLWGKDLYVHLDEVYRTKSKYVVMFVSEHYRDKVWTNHERQSAQARALQDKGDEYILVARFDMTEIPGIRPTIAYIDCQEKSPSALAVLIMKKISMTEK